MSLREQILEAQKIAMKERDEKKLAILRVLWSAMKNLEIDVKHELEDEEVQKVVATQVKQLSDALMDFESAQRQDLIDSAKFEIETLKKYLPEQMSDSDLENVVKRVIQDFGPNLDIGKITGLVMKEVKGKADGNRVKNLVSKLA